MSTLTDIKPLIVRSDDIRGGRPRIAGTGVTVRRIVGWYQMGLTPDEIADRLEHLTLPQVQAALAYFHANRSEIEADIAAEETEARQSIKRGRHEKSRRISQQLEITLFPI